MKIAETISSSLKPFSGGVSFSNNAIFFVFSENLSYQRVCAREECHFGQHNTNFGLTWAKTLSIKNSDVTC